MFFRLTKYGRREIALATVVAAAACAAAAWLFWPAALVPVLLWVFVIAFFRDPDRCVPAGGGLFLSPADGRVTDVTNVGAESPLGRDGVQVGIFMNLLDVHVNRSPAAGRVERMEHRDGAFLDARDPEASARNESATIHMTCRCGGREFPVVVRQVAGLIARRIVTDAPEGRDVRAGQRIGMIKFGSRLELLVPRELVGEVRVRRGQRVRAGETVLIAATKETSDEAAKA